MLKYWDEPLVSEKKGQTLQRIFEDIAQSSEKTIMLWVFYLK